MRRVELYAAITITSNIDAIRWCREKGLLKQQAVCTECNSNMTEEAHKCNDGIIWRCRKIVQGIRHQKKESIRHRSMFENSGLSIKDNIFLLYEWSVNTSVQQTSYELQVPKETVINTFKKFRTYVSKAVQFRWIQQDRLDAWEQSSKLMSARLDEESIIVEECHKKCGSSVQ
jgi:hypothetical protein